MWCRKKWITITVVAVSLLLLVGSLGGVVYAQTGSAQKGDPRQILMAKVAAILGIDQTKLENAFAQAQQQIQDEELANRLQSLVSSGNVSQQQANQYKQWWAARPNMPDVPGLGPRDPFGPPAQDQDEKLASRLQSLVSQDTLTQQQANQYQQWLESRPSISWLEPKGPGLPPKPGVNPPRPPEPPKIS